jgi:hypothetical protein
MMTKAHFVNEMTPDDCPWLPGPAVNEIYVRSRVGLCLSHRRRNAGFDRVPFSGFSVVSTPSVGGRDFYFDDEFCIIAQPDPRSIREAVEAMIARAITSAPKPWRGSAPNAAALSTWCRT